MPDDSRLRIGDAERARAAEALAAHFAAGRLDPWEFEDRSRRAYAARYLADLYPLFDDLPPSQPPSAERHAQRRAAWRVPRRAWMLLFVVVFAFAVAGTQALHLPPLFIPALVVLGLMHRRKARACRSGRRRWPARPDQAPFFARR